MRKNRLPLAVRIERLKNHIAGIEHFAGPEHPAPTFDLTKPFDRQSAVICCMHQGLTVENMVDVLGLPLNEIEFERDIALQNAE